MCRACRCWLALCVAVAPLGARGARGADSADATQGDALADAAEALGSGDPAAREEAMKVLWAAGRAAEPALREAVETGGPEAAARARALLEKIEIGLRPDSPANVLAAAEAFRAADGNSVHAAVDAAMRLLRGGNATAPVFVRLWAREPDERVKAGVRHLLVAASQRCVPLLIGDGYDADAETVLEMAAAERGGQAGLDYAAYLLARGKLDDAVKRRAADPAPSPGKPDKAMGWLLLLSGDHAGAVERAQAKATADAVLVSAARHAAGDWAALARERHDASVRLNGSLNDLSVSAYYALLAGRPDDLEAALERVRDAGRARPHDEHLSYELFLLAGRTDEGVRLMEAGMPQAAFRLLCHRLRLDEAFALAGRADRTSKHFAAVQAELARRHAALGEKDKATKAVETAAAAAASLPPHEAAPVNAAVVEVEAMLGLRDRSVARLASSDAPAALVPALFPSKPAAPAWWARLTAERPREPARATLARLEELLGGKAPAEEVERLCAALRDEAVAAAAKETPQRHGVLAAADMLLAYGRAESAAACLEAGGAAGLAEAWVKRGDLEADQGRWDVAAGYYARARALAPDDPVAAYLHGRASARAGRADEGRKLQETANALPLGGEWPRDRLAEAMRSRGLKDEAAAQWATLVKVNGAESFYGGQAARRLALVAAERGEFARAADLLDRSLIGAAALNQGFAEPGAPVALRLRVDGWRALDRLLASSQPAPAEVEAMLRLVRVLPGDPDWVIETVNHLDARGRRDVADKLFAAGAAPLKAVCEKYPDAAAYHNSLAWLCARCGRDLDAALAHATRAVGSQPKNAAFIDTLAEALFRKGDVARAVDEMKKCLEIDPESAYFKEQLKRFETAAAPKQ